jgi:hypothetical protein
MARIIDSFKFEHAQWQDFLTKTRKELKQESFYNVMRWYIGATNVNYGLNQLAETFLLRAWVPAFVDEILLRTQDKDFVHYREGTFCAAGPKSRGIKFQASNYLDNLTKRYHYVVQGVGEFHRLEDGHEISYAPGTLIEFTKEDYDKVWINNYGTFTEQIVVCLGDKNQSKIPNWELFAATGAKS